MHDNNKHSDLRSFHRFAWMRFWGNSPALNLLADDPQASVSVEISGKQVASSTHNKDPSSGESIVRFEEDNQQEVMVWTCGFLWQIAIFRYPIPVLTSEVTSRLSRTKQFKKKQDWTFRCRVLRDPSWYFSHYTEGRPSPWILTSNYTKTTGTLPPNTRNSPRYLRHPFWTPGLVTQSNPCRQQPLDLRPLGHRSVAMSHPRQGGRMFRASLGLMNGFQRV